MIVVREWVGGGLFVLGNCCYVLYGCMNGASPVMFVFVQMSAAVQPIGLDLFFITFLLQEC